jgi:hypothetical protein
MIKPLTINHLDLIKDNHYSIEQLKTMLTNKNYFNVGYFENNSLIGYVLTNVSDQVDVI